MWESTDEEDYIDNITHNSSAPLNSSATKLITLLSIFLLVWQSVFRVANVSMGLLFKFLSLFLLKLSETTGSQTIQYIYDRFPDTLLKAQAMQSVDRDSFLKLIVCPKCHSTYEESDCIGVRVIPECSFQSIHSSACEVNVGNHY